MTIFKQGISIPKQPLPTEVTLFDQNYPFLTENNHFISETENNYYLITDLVSGGEMIDMVEGSRGLPESQVRKYITQILTALQHLHQNGLVHR